MNLSRKIRKLTVFDISMIKLSAFALALFIASLWKGFPELLPWWGWLIIVIVAVIKPILTCFR